MDRGIVDPRLLARGVTSFPSRAWSPGRCCRDRSSSIWEPMSGSTRFWHRRSWERAGRCFAFEPFPTNIAYLEKHLALNGVRNVTLFKAAVSDHSGKASFRKGPNSSMGRLGQGGELTVDLVSLDDLFHSNAVPLPDCVKIDVEGAELAVLAGARHVLTLAHPTIFLATHGNEVHGQCLSLLRSLGYTCRPLDAARGIESCDEVVAVKEAVAPGPLRPGPGPSFHP